MSASQKKTESTKPRLPLFQGILPLEFRLAVVTGATVVLVGVEEGILLAVVLSLLDHVLIP
jgi:MFS superfamily sulfate permease-like transporter